MIEIVICDTCEFYRVHPCGVIDECLACRSETQIKLKKHQKGMHEEYANLRMLGIKTNCKAYKPIFTCQ